MNLERRYVASAVEVRQVGTQRVISGYASVFNTPSSPLLGYTERVAPGAFKRALAEKQDVRFLMNHDPNMLMGRTKNGTLRLSEDAKGLKFSNDLPDTQAARDLYALIKRGDMAQCSFSFICVKDTWGEEQNAAGDWVSSRSLDDVDLLDCSAVTYPVYEQTEVNSLNEGEEGDDDDAVENEDGDDRPLPEDLRARRFFPDGIPAEIRSRLSRRASGVIVPTDLDVKLARNSIF